MYTSIYQQYSSSIINIDALGKYIIGELFPSNTIARLLTCILDIFKGEFGLEVVILYSIWIAVIGILILTIASYSLELVNISEFECGR